MENEPEQRVLGLTVVPDLLCKLGADPRRVLAAAGVEEQVLSDPANMIPYAAGGRLLRECVASTGCAHFGLLLGEHWDSLSRGLPAQLSLSAQTVGEAIAAFLQYQHLNTSGAVNFLSRRGSDALLHYGIYAIGIEATDQIKSVAMAAAFNAMRKLCGDGWRPTEVHMAFREPADPRPYHRFFGAHVLFDSAETALVFSARWLKQPLPSADAKQFERLKRYAKLAGEADPVVIARRTVTSQLSAEEASGEKVAQTMGMHRRTLHRKLQRGGTSFQKVLDDVQFAVTCQILRDTDLPGIEIAALLDYGDASGFVRAFKRWAGMTPEAWRTAQRMSTLASDRTPARRQAHLPIT
jgi:AraC-like DNA-binding protein